MTKQTQIDAETIANLIDRALGKKQNVIATLSDALKGAIVPDETIEKIVNAVHFGDSVGAVGTKNLVINCLKTSAQLPEIVTIATNIYSDDTPRKGNTYIAMRKGIELAINGCNDLAKKMSELDSVAAKTDDDFAKEQRKAVERAFKVLDDACINVKLRKKIMKIASTFDAQNVVEAD